MVGPISGVKFQFCQTKNKFWWFQKVERKESVLCPATCYGTGPLDLLAFTIANFYFFGWGPDLFGGAMQTIILRGSCQQLLTLPTFKSATDQGILSFQSSQKNDWDKKLQEIIRQFYYISLGFALHFQTAANIVVVILQSIKYDTRNNLCTFS